MQKTNSMMFISENQRGNFGRKGGLVWQESRRNQKTWRKSM